MKPERIQFRFSLLVGWILLTKWIQETAREEPDTIWTAFEMSDHLEACELVLIIGRIADRTCATPDIDVRGNIVFVTCGSSKEGLTNEDFDFAEAIDKELGTAQRQPALLTR